MRSIRTIIPQLAIGSAIAILLLATFIGCFGIYRSFHLGRTWTAGGTATYPRTNEEAVTLANEAATAMNLEGASNLEFFYTYQCSSDWMLMARNADNMGYPT